MVLHYWDGEEPAIAACDRGLDPGDRWTAPDQVPYVSIRDWDRVSCSDCLLHRGAIKIAPPHDDVNHPSHYTQYPVEVIEITERLNFLMGNVVKYVLRADHKGEPLKDLKKARWYPEREISNREAASQASK